MFNKDYKEMLSILLEEKVEFVLIGAYSIAIYGLPRATGDLDIFVNPTKENSGKIYKALARFGAPMKEITKDTFIEKDTIFQIGVIPCRIDIINQIDGVTFKECFDAKVIVKIAGLDIPVISKSHLIKNKQATGRMKDQVDVNWLLEH